MIRLFGDIKMLLLIKWCSKYRKFWNGFNNEFREHEMLSKKVSEYDPEIPQSQTADNPVAPLGRAAQPSRDIRKTN